ELLAHDAGKVDVEALRIAVRAGEVERRIVGLGEKADGVEARQIGPLRPPPRIPEARNLHDGIGYVALGMRLLRRVRRQQDQQRERATEERQGRPWRQSR